MVINEKFIREFTGLKVSVRERCSSTFDEIGNNDVIVALSQERGAGRGDHKFFSPEGGVYIVMRALGLHIDAHTLTPAIGLAAYDTIKSVLGLETRLKWVNDVMLDGKKTAGILCKCPRRGEYLIGIGVNYATDPAQFVKAGLPDATSLNAPETRVTAFVTGLIKRMRTATLATFDYRRYNAVCATVGKNISFTHNGAEVRGFAESVGADGSLIVRIGTATVAVDSGEVSIVREASEIPDE